MIRHLVLFNARPETTLGEIDAAVAALRDLPNLIPQARNFSAGVNVVPSERAYTFGLACDFEDVAALQTYREHPEHQRVLKEILIPATTSIVSVDYEV